MWVHRPRDEQAFGQAGQPVTPAMGGPRADATLGVMDKRAHIFWRVEEARVPHLWHHIGRVVVGAAVSAVKRNHFSAIDGRRCQCHPGGPR